MAIQKFHLAWDNKIPADKVGEDGYYEAILEEFGKFHIRHSAIADSTTERTFRKFLKGRKEKTILEIGTHKGTSTALLAHYFDKVITLDIAHYPEAVRLWYEFGVLPKIEYFLIDNDSDKIDLLLDLKLPFDIAFIDGSHKKEGLEIDFGLTKKCGKVLFHDYYTDYTQMPKIMLDAGLNGGDAIKELVDSLPSGEVIKEQPFAFWEREKDGK